MDASDVGAGAILTQMDGNDVQPPVSFFSRKFNSYQLNYSVIEKETLALVWALQHFDVWIVISVDHQMSTEINNHIPSFPVLSKSQTDAMVFVFAILLFGYPPY